MRQHGGNQHHTRQRDAMPTQTTPNQAPGHAAGVAPTAQPDELSEGTSSASTEQRSGLDDLARLLGRDAHPQDGGIELLALVKGGEVDAPEKPAHKDARSFCRLLGERLMTARNLSEMSQVEAAIAVGYMDGVHVDRAEKGSRLLPLEKLIKLAHLYGVSLDYLLGATDDPVSDRDEDLQRRITDAVVGRMALLANVILSTNIKAVREMGLDTAETLQMAEQAVEIELALGKLRQLNPHLDEEAKGLATLVMKAQAHADAGRRAIERHKRAHRMAAARVREADQEAFDVLGGDCAASLLATADPEFLGELLKTTPQNY